MLSSVYLFFNYPFSFELFFKNKSKIESQDLNHNFIFRKIHTERYLFISYYLKRKMKNSNKKALEAEQTSSNSFFYLVSFVLVLAVALLVSIRQDVPEFAVEQNNHHSIYEKNFFQNEALNSLKEIIRSIKFSIIADVTGVLGAGETKPVGDDHRVIQTVNTHL